MSGAAEAAFRKWYRTQSVAAVLCTGFLVVEKPVAMGLAAELGVLALAAFTGACGWRLLRCALVSTAGELLHLRTHRGSGQPVGLRAGRHEGCTRAALGLH